MLLTKFVSQLKIITKERGLAKLGDVMNYAQYELLAECERQLRETGRIRIIVLKARQIGISTIIEAVTFALTMVFDNFNSLIVSHDAGSAEHIKTMTDTYWTSYVFRHHHQERYRGKKHLAWGDTDSQIQVTTAKTVGAARSRTIHCVHASEFAFWVNPSEFMTALKPSMPTQGVTAIFIESTANGIGNSFHQEWEGAVKRETEFKPLFFPWWKHPEYTAEHLPAAIAAQYIPDVLTAEEEALQRLGVSMSRLTWRRYAIANLVNKDKNKVIQNPIDAFHQEYPSNPIEAFVSTGRNIFPLPKLLSHYDPLTGTQGRLVRIGNTVEFIEDENGPLTIYRYPSTDRSWGVYRIGADPTHTTTGDYACAQVISRRTLEQVAVLRRKCDPITFGEELFLLGLFYNTACIAPEKEGPGFATVGYLLGQSYPDVWESQKVDKTPGKVTADTFGWSTNGVTKHLAVSTLLKCITDPLHKLGDQTYGLVIHDQLTLAEMRDYVTDTKGSGYINADGSEYDDGVMALAIAASTHFIDPLIAPYDPQAPVVPVKTPGAERIDEALKEVGTSAVAIMQEVRESHHRLTAPWEDWK